MKKGLQGFIVSISIIATWLYLLPRLVGNWKFIANWDAPLISPAELVGYVTIMAFLLWALNAIWSWLFRWGTKKETSEAQDD